MSPIAQLKHELQNRLRELDSASFVFTAVTNLGTFSAQPAASLAALGKQVDDLLAEQVELTSRMKPGVDWFTLTRNVAALRVRIETTREALDEFWESVKSGAIVAK